MVFASPEWLYALLVLPVVAAVEWWITRRDRDRLARLVARALWGRVLRAPSETWRWVRLGLFCLGVAGIVLALARPQWGIIREKIEREGVDVVLVVDTSGSMATEDVKPSRFALARLALLSLVSRLEGDRFALVAFEGDAYPLVPLTLDADAVGLFLDTLEPGAVPSPGTSLGSGLARGVDLFVDEARPNKVMILISDGEDLEGEVDAAIERARTAKVVIHTVAVGTEAGQPVPDFDRDGRRVGFKKKPDGSVVISRVDTRQLEKIARATGGSSFRITPADTTLGGLVGAIEGMEARSVAKEFSYRRRERFQVPLAAGLLALLGGLVLPLPRIPRPRWGRRAGAASVLAIALAGAAPQPSEAAEQGRVVDELLLKPKRLTQEGRRQQQTGDYPGALEAFEAARAVRPMDPRTAFNLAGALYKNGRYDDAEALYRALAADAPPDLAAPVRFNLGNTLYQKKDYSGAIQAFRDALRRTPDDEASKRNLELALRALQEQKEQQERQQQQQEQQGDQDKKESGGQPGDDQKRQDPQQNQQGQRRPQDQRPPTQEEREQERFRKEAGMPKERAMQLLDALQRNEEEQRRKELSEQRAESKGDKDW